MDIDVFKYILNDIGDVSWHEDSQLDDISSKHMDKLDEYLTFIENLREYLLGMLFEHRVYRKENASSRHLHYKAGDIIQKHIIQDRDFNPLGEEWTE